ncbi:hypothetical protein HU200_063235 [Digitaria exilis]|uniref:Uncharacterized protein n=1 Tax=Digitaria exilis TaxID=1010633 RepID=A0A835A1V8_9POAL|nr:hypothetical protein HU200_063235 [Digitaria exilis]
MAFPAGQGPHVRLPGAAAADDVQVQGGRGAPRLLHSHRGGPRGGGGDRAHHLRRPRRGPPGRGRRGETARAPCSPRCTRSRTATTPRGRWSAASWSSTRCSSTWPSWWRRRGRSSTTSREPRGERLPLRAERQQGAGQGQRSSRKWLCIGIIILLLLVLLVIVPIATNFRKSLANCDGGTGIVNGEQIRWRHVGFDDLDTAVVSRAVTFSCSLISA